MGDRMIESDECQLNQIVVEKNKYDLNEKGQMSDESRLNRIARPNESEECR